MNSRSTSVIVAALAAMISASPVQAGGLKQIAEISTPGEPITDIGIMNGAYTAPGYPWIPEDKVVYTAPADEARYKKFLPSRPPTKHTGYGYREQADAWVPGPGDRFKVTEIEKVRLDDE